jgi:wyosine [tRNA(Phe)-imidazoG37] synthetase (radical SAM superfamily)
MYKYLFGPVPSRRLGMSLGVDLIPHKICSFNCVYCECGKTLTHTLERKEYVPTQQVLDELGHFFSNSPDPDYITFSGAGEPTLHSQIGEVITFVKTLRPNIPLAVLTNGSLLWDEKVRKEIELADVVLPSLDAAVDKVFREIDRPVGQLKMEDYIQGLIDFRAGFNGKILLEVLILPGINDGKENLDALKSAFLKIKPDQIQLNTLDRPGTIKNLRAADNTELQNIKKYWGLENVEIIAAVVERKEIASYRDDLESAILETIARRPCTLDDLHKILGIHINEINKYLGTLEEVNKIKSERLERGLFYQIVR